MDFILATMEKPVDNLLGMLLWAVVYMLGTGIVFTIALWLIPNRIPYGVKSAIVGIAVFISLFVWWGTIIN
ncbi:hypothetical protein NC661_10165 [Aquibacillus koreensis]|uniref:Uncharacterized protein n=1 Tax=Aquibacillus koreensis TaxID=279446 RepID=A0A9X3WIQ5_9BACI|nr:hypothetical protein [Aquibacillus koreensis]MCT2534223.1 hypothetical protein [Aquibacillus koreensis]MDC3420732.1 hypothetical protein [Aquibacillus koreensis]